MNLEKLDRDVYRAFEDVLGPDNISEDPAVTEPYGWQPFSTGVGVIPGQRFGKRAKAAVLPGNTAEVQAIVKLCNKYGLEYLAISTGWGAYTVRDIKIDMRRMNRIIEINEKNMYAVVEPYVIGAELQAELMKRGFSFGVTGAGANCTAFPFGAAAGIGPLGESHSYRERNILGVEWVTPDGEVVQFGSVGSSGEWFCGDGPGPSLRGVVLGPMSPQGGMGVFTRAATKIYHWAGPTTFPIEGVSPHYVPSPTPPNFSYRNISFKSPEDMVEAQRRIGESEIALEVFGLNVAMLARNMATNNEEDVAYFEQFRKLIQGQGFHVILLGNSPEDFEYKKQVLEQIVDETKGKYLEVVEDPEVAGGIIWRCTRETAAIRECFRGGMRHFAAVLGITHPFSDEVRFMEFMLPIKKELIEKGMIRDDNVSYLSWSNECGHLGHGEILFWFVNESPELLKAAADLVFKGIKISIDSHYGVGCICPPDLYGPLTCNYHVWMRALKRAFDPNNLSDCQAYISGKEPAPGELGTGY